MRLFLRFIIFLGSFSLMFADLRNPKIQSNYLIIFHEDYKDDVVSFQKWRENKGYKVTAINLAEIVDEFHSENVIDTTKAILNFTEYIINNWKNPRLQYLLIVGSINHIPSVKINSFYNSTPYYWEDSVHTDVLYTTIPSKSINEYYFSIGRFPARNRDELKNMFNKTYLFEDNYKNLTFQKNVIHFTDLEDSNMFNISSRYLLKKYPNKSQTLSLPFLSEKSLEEFRQEFINLLSKGTYFLGYLGHGNPFVLSRSKIIDSEYLDTLSAKSPPFIYYSLSCSQSFDNPKKKSIIEQLISKEGFGAVATVSSSAITTSYFNECFLERFLQEFITSDDVTIGSSITKSRITYPYFDNLMNLMGDPALKVPFYIIASVLDQINPYEFLVYPNPASDYIEISFDRWTPPSRRSPSDNVQIFNTLGIEVGQSSLIDDRNRIDISNLPTGVYFVKIGDRVEKFVKM